MKLIGIAAIALTTLASAHTAEDQAYFAIFAETKLMKMVGMPAIKLPPNLKLPPGVHLPAIPGMPTRTLDVRLWSPSIAPDGATASIVPPAGLKQGPKLDLDLYRPTATEGTGGAPGAGFDPDSNPDFTIKIYWGSSDTVKPDQPRIIKWGGLTPEQRAVMKQKAQEAQRSIQNYFYKPNWTTAYWPSKGQKGTIDDDASLSGTYALTTSYTGNVSLEVPSGIDFLAPIEMTAPNLEQKLPLEGSIPFQWTQIPSAIGLYASAMGVEGKNTIIMWSSSEEFKEGLMGDMGFLQMAEVRDHVADKLFMPGTQTSATIPAGIFKSADFAMFNMVGYGPGAAMDKVQPLPRLQTKTSLNIMLGGLKMKDMHGGRGREK